jgi:ribosomal protein L9
MLITVSCLASAETTIPVEKLFTSGDPVQVSLGYQRCFVVMHIIGNAAIKSKSDDGADLVAISQRYSTLFKNAVDLRTEGKQKEVQANTMDLIKMYGQIAAAMAKRPDTKQSLFMNDAQFCKKWSDDL